MGSKGNLSEKLTNVGSSKNLSKIGKNKILNLKKKNNKDKLYSIESGHKTRRHLKIGVNYEVEITCAFNPSYFYIQTLSSLSKIANLMNNMSNYYRNEDEFNDVKE